jgi:hypothetical protein
VSVIYFIWEKSLVQGTCQSSIPLIKQNNIIVFEKFCRIFLPEHVKKKESVQRYAVSQEVKKSEK